MCGGKPVCVALASSFSIRVLLIEVRSMAQLTSEGQRIVQDFSVRHGFSQDAVTEMLTALVNGNGTMAQFSHSEFGGSGQWMRGGMIMLGDMFNNSLKGRVDSLCNELSHLLANEPGLLQTGSFQRQSQNGTDDDINSIGSSPRDATDRGGSKLFVADSRSNWWPVELGSPSATGSQNSMRYAYFPSARRLAVDAGGEAWVYDTLNHQINGFSQQQGTGTSISFSSQMGTVELSSLPVVTRNGQPVTSATPAPSSIPADSAEGDIFAAIERLAALKASGILTEQEFATKKAELLSRI